MHGNATLLIWAVLAVGVLHTLVPDHWVPIAALARRHGWSSLRTALAAAGAGLGHVSSTLLLGLAVWTIGAVAAARYAHLVDVFSALALIGFGTWFAVSGWRELHGARDHGHEHFGHAHVHRHSGGLEHTHWHEHQAEDWHVGGGAAALHEHSHAASGRTALILILGSSPMIEGLPLFFAASTAGAQLIVVMALVFALATIATYVVVTTTATLGLQRVSFGPVERYGEMLSGAFVALVGLYALLSALYAGLR
jgi:ABC-type nickel/cobalt efflux system permease component RcnA